MSIKQRGFGSMAPERQREIASLGGRAAHEHGTAHQWTTDEARLAGRKGGLNSAKSRRARRNTSDESVSNPAAANLSGMNQS